MSRITLNLYKKGLLCKWRRPLLLLLGDKSRAHHSAIQLRAHKYFVLPEKSRQTIYFRKAFGSNKPRGTQIVTSKSQHTSGMSMPSLLNKMLMPNQVQIIYLILVSHWPN